MIWDLITIGGGAAGFYGTITFAESGGGTAVILERTSHVLGKVKISGGGRCNVTHACFDPKELSTFYPRGEKSLIGPLHGWGAQETVDWFEGRGVELKTERDGRMFPVTNRSQSVIDCLSAAAADVGIEVRTGCGVTSIQRVGERFHIETESGEVLDARRILLATGGTRLAAGARLAEALGHQLAPAVPSLFTFKIDDPRLSGIPGVSVADASCRVPGTRLASSGPVLVTHWGLSGPCILKLSAWGARELSAIDYRFQVVVNWLPHLVAESVQSTLADCRSSSGKRQIDTRSPFETIPKRLWIQLVAAAGIPHAQSWARLSRNQAKALGAQLGEATFEVDGKSMNKDEFVTCGGVLLKEIDLRTMESRLCPGLHFAGEVIDVDGLTGGYNFQNAWTTGHHAGRAMAGSLG